MAIRDAPEVASLGVLLAAAYAGAAYTCHRIYFTPVGASFPSAEVRRDPDKQVAYGALYNQPSLWYKIAQWKSDDKGYNVGIFDNRFRPFEHNLPTQGTVHSAPQYETNTAAKPASMS
ncbi:hypothetical protein GPECTOR_12g592 [Gonium pectorale]|uniref:Uncharacterized protein n=1 Tax=Gonium pectorale TaxID=33097 RepID=A0A150GPH0_GONPE|nr:hypothetical protein GPECTOR_12g592 [Gonium pectorale]|eukprot:KXZ51628.1 hypothetical protein GPECTOR_12g592 [Gonium pectorale]